MVFIFFLLDYFTSDLQTLKTKLGLPKWTGGERDGLWCGMGTRTLSCMKWLANRDLLYSTGNSPQYSMIIHMGKRI